eukprot:3298894-Rhodomonas_salina.1
MFLHTSRPATPPPKRQLWRMTPQLQLFKVNVGRVRVNVSAISPDMTYLGLDFGLETWPPLRSSLWKMP